MPVNERSFNDPRSISEARHPFSESLNVWRSRRGKKICTRTARKIFSWKCYFRRDFVENPFTPQSKKKKERKELRFSLETRWIPSGEFFNVSQHVKIKIVSRRLGVTWILKDLWICHEQHCWTYDIAYASFRSYYQAHEFTCKTVCSENQIRIHRSTTVATLISRWLFHVSADNIIAFESNNLKSRQPLTCTNLHVNNATIRHRRNPNKRGKSRINVR